MPRKSIDCRDHPDGTGCTLYLSGEKDEVIRAAAEHAGSVYGMKDTPELRTHEWRWNREHRTDSSSR